MDRRILTSLATFVEGIPVLYLGGGTRFGIFVRVGTEPIDGIAK